MLYDIYMKDESCKKCQMIIKDPIFWDSHQTMSDGRVWCAKRT
jgi:hypothetical protein